MLFCWITDIPTHHVVRVFVGTINAISSIDLSKESLGWFVANVLFPIGIPLLVYWGAERRFKEIGDALPTHYVGSFPKHVSNIIELVEGAKDELLILGDCVDYGSFRSLDLEMKLLSAVEKAQGVVKDVEFLVWGDAQTMSRANKYRNAQMRRSEEFRRDIREFLNNLKKYEPIFVRKFSIPFNRVTSCLDNTRYDWGEPWDLQVLQFCLHEWQANRLRKGDKNLHSYLADGSGSQAKKISEAAITTERLDGVFFDQVRKALQKLAPATSISPEVFFWIADRKRAVFLLPCDGRDALAFATADRRLITALRQIFYQKLKDAHQAVLIQSTNAD